jgi:hypothetical protein
LGVGLFWQNVMGDGVMGSPNALSCALLGFKMVILKFTEMTLKNECVGPLSKTLCRSR